MKIATTTNWLWKIFGIEKTIELIANAGFNSVDLCDIASNSLAVGPGWEKRVEAIRKLADDIGVDFCQTHAPVIGSLLSEGFTYDDAIERTARSLEMGAMLGATAAVVHPIQESIHSLNPDHTYAENMKFFSKLLPYAKEYGIKIAIENMVYADSHLPVKRDGVCASPVEFKKYIDDLNSEYVTGCLDIGHAAISGREPQDVLRQMGSKYITCTHIHDNDYVSDSHALPCTMKLNWEEICKAMAETGYSGCFTLEAVCFLPKYSPEFIPTALKFMYETSAYLVRKIEQYAQK